MSSSRKGRLPNIPPWSISSFPSRRHTPHLTAQHFPASLAVSCWEKKGQSEDSCPKIRAQTGNKSGGTSWAPGRSPGTAPGQSQGFPPSLLGESRGNPPKDSTNPLCRRRPIFWPHAAEKQQQKTAALPPAPLPADVCCLLANPPGEPGTELPPASVSSVTLQEVTAAGPKPCSHPHSHPCPHLHPLSSSPSPSAPPSPSSFSSPSSFPIPIPIPILLSRPISIPIPIPISHPHPQGSVPSPHPEHP